MREPSVSFTMRDFHPIAALALLAVLAGCAASAEPDGTDHTPPSPRPVKGESSLDGRDLDALAAGLKDPDPDARTNNDQAQPTSYQDGHPRRRAMIKTHITNLRDKDPEVRQTSAQILGQIGALEAIPDLIEALKDSHVYVQIYAHGALNKLTGKNFGYKNYDGWSQWWKGIQGDLEAFNANRRP